MTQEEKQAIIDLQGSPGWKVINNLVRLKIDELKDVTNLDQKSQVGIGIQALANQKSVKFLREFLSDLSFNQTIKTDNTYE